MGAQPSTFSHELKNPTRTLSSQLHLNDKQRTFTFVQHMQKAVGEQQTLRTRTTYTGTLHTVGTDVTDGKGRVVKGCPVYRLRTERVRFEVEWGSEWWQCKKGTLTREDILVRDRRRGAKTQKLTPIVTSTVTPSASSLFTASTAVTAPPSPSSVNRSSAAAAISSCAFSASAAASSSSMMTSAASSSSFAPVLLPPALDSLPRGFSHSTPLSPAPLSLSERQRSHIDVETSGETPVQPITADTKAKSSSSSSTTLAAATTGVASPSSTSLATATTKASHPHTVTVSYHGAYHTQLQAATSLEEMADLLQADTSDWTGSFGVGGLELHCRVLSEEVRVEYWRPKFEYLWAQVADECPVIMALSNVFHDQQMQEMYLPRTLKS